jgi:hypothetical protein
MATNVKRLLLTRRSAGRRGGGGINKKVGQSGKEMMENEKEFYKNKSMGRRRIQKHISAVTSTINTYFLLNM